MLYDQQGADLARLVVMIYLRISTLAIYTWPPFLLEQFWNVKVNVRRPSSLLPSTESVDQQPAEPSYSEEERKETAISLKDKQLRMEQQVYRIWT